MSVVGTLLPFRRFGQRRADVGRAREALVVRDLSVVASSAPTTPPDLEGSLPRWRRPSLIAARKTDGAHNPSPGRSRLVFDVLPGSLPGTDERRLIRYSVAPLLDAPDEFRGGTIGQLTTGDEVVVVDRSGAYRLVDCPDGRRGWIHRTTLGGPGH